MAITTQALLVTDGLGQRLPKSDADVLDRVMGVDMQIAISLDLQIDQTVPRNLVQHVVQKRHAAGQRCRAAAIQVDSHRDTGLGSVAVYACGTHGVGQ